MIITRISGGLGNQMFQYTLGVKLASMQDTRLKIDISEYGTNNMIEHDEGVKRYFQLSHFDISAEIASDEDIRSVLRFGHRGRKMGELLLTHRPIISRAVSLFRDDYGVAGRLFNYYNERYEDRGRFNPAVLTAGKDAYLHGCWQSPKYFEDIRQILLDEFSLNGTLTEASQNVKVTIKDKPVSVGLHIRRGDWVELERVLPMTYIEQAMAQFSDIDPTFFVFSDDIEWAKDNVESSHSTTFVDHNDSETAHEDFDLMRSCDHNIISNSSFSWWAAYLNKAPEQRVVAPYLWVPGDEYMEDVDEMELLPDEWQVLRW